MSNQSIHRFLEDEFLSLTIGAVVQRGNVYLPNLTEAQRRSFHRTLRQELATLLPQYRGAVGESAHIQNIVTLCNRIGARHRNILTAGAFRIGSAQKALNLYLKYQWCMGWIPMPPHCPFDAIVLRFVPGSEGTPWTKIDTESAYEKLVSNAKIAADGKPLAQWELDLYNTAVNLDDDGIAACD